ncbi:DUF3383 family protein [Acetobacter sp. P5B1]|uniref:DUF3383 family protein n=1 Tax=Acetobacter sp. P5B1 TaxID=2762620 RepID=UPI001C043F4A|nr:DUF3383 family protein [Acetobacter sp. P5B1]
MTLSISSIIKVVPGVISPTGNVNILTGLVLSTNTSLAAGLTSFTSASSVATACGSSSVEAQIAAVYFAGYTDAQDTPAKLYFYQLPASPVDADYGTYLSDAASATSDWAPFMFAQEPNATAKTAVAAWMAANPKRYWAVIQDNDTTILTADATSTFGATVLAAGTDGITCFDNTDGNGTLRCAAALSWAGCINPARTNGRTSLMFRTFSTIVASSITDAQAENLLANGYNFYGSYKPYESTFNWMVNGQVSGKYLWADAYINQIWMNASFKEALADMFSSTRVPMDSVGDTIVEAALQPTIEQALSFGAIDVGITLSSDEVSQVNSMAGKTIAGTLQAQGYYLIPGASAAAAATREQRTAINGMFFYTDAGSVQSISLNSVEVQ